MGRFAEYARKTLNDRMKRDGSTAEVSALQIQSKIQEAIREREDAIANVKARYGDPPHPTDWQKVIGNEQFYIGLEREWMREFDDPQSLSKTPLEK